MPPKKTILKILPNYTYIQYTLYRVSLISYNYNKNKTIHIRIAIIWTSLLGNIWGVAYKKMEEWHNRSYDHNNTYFYNSNYSWVMPLKSWSKMVENAMRDTGIDILALQDGIGVKNTTIKQLDSLFSYTKLSTDKLGVRLYGNVGTFDSTPEGNVPASKERIKSQLLIQKPYVEKLVAFSLNHFQRNQDKNQLNGFIKYLEKDLYCYFGGEND